MSAIISLDDYKGWRTMTGTAFDTPLEVLREIAEEIVVERCGCNFDAGTFTENYDGDGSQDLRVKTWGITSITSIKLINGYIDGTAQTQTLDSDSYTHDGIRTIHRIPRDNNIRFGSDEWGTPISPLISPFPIFIDGSQNYEIVYTAGFVTADMPKTLKHAVYLLIDSMFETRGLDQIRTLTKTDSGVSRTMMSVAEENERIRRLIKKYRIAF